MKTVPRLLIIMLFANFLAVVPAGAAPGGGEQAAASTGSRACDCCIQCKLAEKEQTAGKGPKDGGPCGDCCRNCSKKLPTDKDVPAEVKPTDEGLREKK